MKNKTISKEIILDARGLECPIPVLKARKLSQNLIKMKQSLNKSINVKKFLITKKREMKDLFNIKKHIAIFRIFVRR